MKKLGIVMASTLLLFSLSACSSGSKHSAGEASSNQQTTKKDKQTITFKNGTLTVPEGILKIDKIVTYDASDPSFDGKVYSAITYYSFTNKTKSAVKPNDIFNKYLTVQEVGAKQTKDLETSAGLQLNKTPFDKLMSNANDGVNAGQTVKVAIPASTSKGHSNKFDVQAKKSDGTVVGTMNIKSKSLSSDDYSTKPDTTKTVHTIGQTGEFGGYKLQVNSVKRANSSTDEKIILANVTLTNNTGSKIDNVSNDQFHLYSNGKELDAESPDDSALTDKINSGIANGKSVTGNIQWKTEDSNGNDFTLKYKPILTQNKTIMFKLNAQ